MVCIGHNPFDMRQVSTYVDATAPVGVLTGLDNPQLLADVRVTPQVCRRFGVVKDASELLELLTVNSICYVIGERQVVKCELSCRFVVDLHVVVNSFFVGEVEVSVLVIRRDGTMLGGVLLLLFVLLFATFLHSVWFVNDGSDAAFLRAMVNIRRSGGLIVGVASCLLERRQCDRSFALLALRSGNQILH